MSCITKILEVKGDKPFIVSGQVAIEGGGKYKGYEYIITFVEMGHRCGYVAIPETHPFHSFNKEYDFPDLHVHGGVTFFKEPRFSELLNGHICTDKWIGFDAGHCYDSQDINTSEKYFGNSEYVAYRKRNPMPDRAAYSFDIKHRTYEYMEAECKKMIDQLVEREI